MKDLNKKNIEDLNKLLIEKRKALYDFRLGIAGSKIKNVKDARKLRKEIARILTEENSRT